ncbi:MAG: VWA domain-containing protein [Planctomycetaceae bacterium]
MAPREALAELRVGSSNTAPAVAVQELLDESRGGVLSAILLLSDGITTTSRGDDLAAAARLARERGVPLYPIGVGSTQPVRDLDLTDLLADEVVFVGDPATLTLRLRSFGYAGESARLVVRESHSDEPLAERPVTLGRDGEILTEELTFVPAAERELQLTVELLPPDDELDRSNNRLEHRLTIRQDQFRVLLVEGPPRWEYRALKPVLERDDTIRLDTFLVQAELDFAPEDRTALPAFPATDALLAEYDVVIWGDVDLAAVDARVPERIRRYVSGERGGLILLAGPRHNPLSYAASPFATLLPVLLEGAGSVDPEQLAGPGFRLRRTEDGAGWPFLRLAENPATEIGIWQGLPAEMYWFISTPSLKPGAQALAVRDAADGDREPLPLIVLQRYGQGMVLYHGTDELWTWRKRVEDLYYGRYWSQAIRTVAANRIDRDDTGRRLTTDRRTYEPGDTVRVRLRTGTAVTASGEPVTVQIESTGGYRTTATLAAVNGQVNLLEAEVRQLPVGEYLATMADRFPDEGAVSTRFSVAVLARELRERAAAITEMQQAARVAHGEFQMVWQAEQLPASLPRGRAVRLSQARPVPLWNRGELLGLLIGVLVAEWLLRRRSRLV